MKRIILSCIVLASASLLDTTARADISLIVNGSFENGNVSGAFSTLAAGSLGLTGWTIEEGQIDYIGSYWEASDGSCSIDLNGFVAGTISQTFATEIGKTYYVTFDMSGNPDGNSSNVNPEKNLLVQAAGQSAEFSFDSSDSTLSDMGWVTQTWSFVATDTTTTLSFTSLDVYSGGSSWAKDNGYGAALDNVSVVAVPIPGSLLLSVIGLGLARGRKRTA